MKKHIRRAMPLPRWRTTVPTNTASCSQRGNNDLGLLYVPHLSPIAVGSSASGEDALAHTSRKTAVAETSAPGIVGASTLKHALVLNQYALPRSEAGGTRHIDLFSRVHGWEPLIVASRRNHYTQEIFETADERFKLAWVPPYSGTGISRIAGWAIFAIQAAVIGLTRRRVDVVYASTPQMLVPVAGVLVSKFRRIPLVVEVRDLWPESIVGVGALRRGSHFHRALMNLERWIYRRADQIVVVTPGWGEHFNRLGIDAKRVHVISNGSETQDFVVSEDRDSLRSEFGLQGFTAIYAGAQGPANALDLLLDAAKELPEISILLVGAGSQTARLLRRAADEGLSNVEFRNPVSKEQLPRLLTACDVGIHSVEPLPVLTQGVSPNKLFDYMASGIPVVSNAEEGLRDIILDDMCGRLGAPDSLADCLRQVYEATDEQRTAWGERGRQLVSTRFSRSAAAAKLESLLQSTGTPEPQ